MLGSPHRILLLGLVVALCPTGGALLGQEHGELLLELHSHQPFPYSLSCSPFLDYQQPFNEATPGTHASFLSDEIGGRQINESTVEKKTIVPVPGALITGMRLWGISFHNLDRVNCYDDDSVPWNVSFYETAADGPGPQVSARTVVPVRTDTGMQIFFPEVTLQQYDFTFVPPIDNTSGTISWIGAQRQLGVPVCVFHWVNETTPDFDNISTWSGSPSYGLNSDMPICLSLEGVPVELESFSID